MSNWKDPNLLQGRTDNLLVQLMCCSRVASRELIVWKAIWMYLNTFGCVHLHNFTGVLWNFRLSCHYQFPTSYLPWLLSPIFFKKMYTVKWKKKFEIFWVKTSYLVFYLVIPSEIRNPCSPLSSSWNNKEEMNENCISYKAINLLIQAAMVLGDTAS